MLKLSKFFFIAFIFCAVNVQAQPPRPKDAPEWLRQIDANKNETIERDEYFAAADKFFKQFDANGNNTLENLEIPLPPGERQSFGENPPPGNHPPRPQKLAPNIIPPFLFVEIGQTDLTRADFDKKIIQKFGQIDRNSDGVINFREVEVIAPQRLPPPEEGENPQRPAPPTAEFLGAEMRFGDKLIKNSPFSADIVTENTRRLFDGTIVSKQSKGAIYRDSQGRTRREQTLDSIGSISIGEPQELVFINDFVGKTHYFIDVNRKVVRRQPMPDNRPPKLDGAPENGKTESLGTKMLEGVKVEGTKMIFEIPAGQLGNTIPIQVVTEKWFSPELQITVMSRLIDPLAGEQIFKLVNIRLGEPSAQLFAVPQNFKLINE